MKPHKGFTSITGETGAGKSILLGALQLLMGQRADSKSLLKEDRKCVVEAVLDLRNVSIQPLFEALEAEYAPETIVRREIAPGGKSRAFVNDTPVTLDVLKQLMLPLIDIHAQHETLSLGNTQAQLQLLDALQASGEVKKTYAGAYQAWQHAKKARQELEADKQTASKTLEYNKFQLEELERCPLDTLNQEALESELTRLEHATQLRERCESLLQTLEYGDFAARPALSAAVQQLHQLVKLYGPLSPLAQQLESCALELREAIATLERQTASFEPDMERLQYVQDNLSTLYKLYKKHDLTSVEALTGLRESLKQQVYTAEHFEDTLHLAIKEEHDCLEACRKAGEQLHKHRAEAAGILVQNLETLLPQVGMPHGRIEIRWTDHSPNPEGIYSPDILFSANKGVAPGPLRQVASGGEFSRLMLCIKYLLAQHTQLATLIFDEIDTGISGEIARKVADLLRAIAQKHQVLCITHLPQMAAAGRLHYFVYKSIENEASVTRLRLLSEQERLQEIAAMIAGDNPSDAALRNAKELLDWGKKNV
jgi:DNA repair protein RecN (Recombination protein N)